MRAAATVLTLLFAATAFTPAVSQTAAQPSNVQAPLIERAKLFGNPSRIAGQLSPDGRWISWIAPRDGVLNIWVAPANNMAAAKPLTNERQRPIRSYFWAPDSRQILFVNDKGGDENFLLYGVDVNTAAQRTLTPFDKTRVQILGVSPLVRDRILIGVNNRDARWHDVHSLNLQTGQLTKVIENNGYAGFFADQRLVVRGAAKARPDGGQSLHRVVDNKVEERPFEEIELDDAQSTSPVGYTADGRTLYWIDSRGRNTSALVAQDTATGAKRVIGQNARADIGGAMANPRTGEVEAYAANYLKNEWTPVGNAVAADLALLRRQLPGEFSVTSRTEADDRWLVSAVSSNAPAATYLYDRRAKRLTKLWDSRPELAGATLARMHPVEIKTRDGLTMPSYLTLPPGTDPDGDGKPNRPVPMVMVIHGGPWARDAYGYNASHQWLANRGYAVLSPNFRSSTGFGKSFLNAGNLEWGRKMQNDIDDAMDWAVAQRIAPRDKVAIMGGSYGGYATLAGLTFTPDRFACGVNIVGVSNLKTLLETIPPYWEAGRAQFHARMGNPNTPEGAALLRERSPLHFADRIRKPLLIGHGANDPRVKQAESDQIVKVMAEKKIPVTYVLFPDEGHGFARPENSIAFNAVAENFLSNCLGGRAEPIGGALRPSTAQVPIGAEIVRGLPEALPARSASGTN
jgi:dipeptidyl aminopeptidase/acylaminoacyl peptidase